MVASEHSSIGLVDVCWFSSEFPLPALPHGFATGSSTRASGAVEEEKPECPERPAHFRGSSHSSGGAHDPDSFLVGMATAQAVGQSGPFVVDPCRCPFDPTVFGGMEVVPHRRNDPGIRATLENDTHATALGRALCRGQFFEWERLALPVLSVPEPMLRPNHQ